MNKIAQVDPHEPITFIIHPLRPIEKYHLRGYIERLRSGIVSIELKHFLNSDSLETKPAPVAQSTIDPGKTTGSGNFPEELRQKLEQLAKKISEEYPDKMFRSRFVTYKDAPTEPEFYDLLFM